jgi:hypothetical protein
MCARWFSRLSATLIHLIALHFMKVLLCRRNHLTLVHVHSAPFFSLCNHPIVTIIVIIIRWRHQIGSVVSCLVHEYGQRAEASQQTANGEAPTSAH